MNVFEVFAKLSLDSSGYDNGLNVAKKAAHSVGTGLKTAAKVGTAALGAASAAVTAFAGASVKTGMEFDKSMSNVAATMGTTTDKIKELRDFAIEMGSTTAFTASQSADALNYMALAGYSAKESMEMLPNVLNLAAAGDIELAQASDMVTDAQSALGLSAKQTKAMVDQMAKASSKTNTSVGQLGDAILTVGGTAQQMKGGTQELTTVLGLLADNGIKGAEGGTKLRNMILSLSSPTDKAAKQMDKLGVKLYDAQGNMREMKDVFGDMSKAMEGMTSEERTQAIADIFNKQDIKAVNALLNTNAKRWEEVYTNVGKAQGAADKMAKTKLDNLQGDVTIFKSALDGAKIAISDSLSPTLREFVQFGTKGIEKLTKAFQSSGLGGAMKTFGELLSEGITKLVDKAPEFVKSGAAMIEGIASGISENKKAIGDALSKLISTLAETVPDVIGSIVDIVIAIIDGITDNADKIVGSIINGINKVIDLLLNKVDKIVTSVFTLLSKILGSVANKLPTLIPKLVDLFTEILTSLFTNIAEFSKNIGPIIKGVITAITEGLTTLIDNAPEIITALIESLIESLPALLEAGITGIGAILASIVKLVPKLLTMPIDTIKGVFTGLWDSADGKKDEKFGGKTVQGAADMATSLKISGENIKGTSGGIQNTVKNLVNTLSDGKKTRKLIDSIGSLFTSVGNAIMTNVKKTWNNFTNGIGNWIKNLWDSIKSWGNKLASWIGGLFDVKKMTEIGMNLIKGIWQGIKDGAVWLVKQMLNFTSGVTKWVKDFWGIKSPSKVWRKEIGRNLPPGIVEGVWDMLPFAKQQIESAMGELTDFEMSSPYMAVDNISTKKSVDNQDSGVVQKIEININNPAVRNDDDITKMADAVSERLGQVFNQYEVAYG